jgi:cytoskeletal protein RodZ
MRLTDQRLVRHLAWMVVVKLIVLAALWWWFVREQRVTLDANDAAQHLAAPTPVSGGSR